VTFSTCLSNGVSPSSPTSVVQAAATACAANPLLQVIVTFDDYPANVISAPTSAQCVVYCGTGMTVNSWVWSPVVPSVTGLSTTSGHITGGTSVTITGTGFVSTTGATTVNLLEESGGSPLIGNMIVPATNVVVNSSTSITFVTPPVIAGSTYFVAVTTTGGTNPYVSSDVFTYTSVAPTVTGFTTSSPTSGSTAGGTSITIKGTGFFSGAVVEFVEESAGVQVTPTLEFPATSVAVNSSTQMTAVSPGVTVAGTYFVTVTTPTGLSSPSTYTSTVGAGTPIFSFSPLVPTVSAITPAVGSTSSGTAVTISGTGFEVGATVTFVQEVAGVATSGSFNATNVTVTGSSTITATAPAATAGTSYFVTVTIPTGLASPTTYTSSTGPILTYS
jgi:IPT/TIG domain-containing protein